MKFFISFLLILFSSPAFSLLKERIDMRKDRLEFRHFRGGKTLAWVKREFDADSVFVAGFYGYKTFDGKKLKCGVDLSIENSVQKIGPQFKNRKVLAGYKNGHIAMYPDSATCLAAGTPVWAFAGMTVPPEPRQRKYRHMLAIKGFFLDRLVLFGTARECLRYIKACGYQQMMHIDGGSSLSKRVIHPSQLLVFRDYYTPTLVASR